MGQFRCFSTGTRPIEQPTLGSHLFYPDQLLVFPLTNHHFFEIRSVSKTLGHRNQLSPYAPSPNLDHLP